MFRIGIIGAGWIAEKMCDAIAPFTDMEIYAIASRTREKAETFAAEHNIGKAYGSYEEMVCDPAVELVYIATPHSHHYDHAMLALEHGKPVLVEKAFTANARQAEKLIETARSKGVFITEAIWTRYMPLSHKIREIMESGIIGEPRVLTATLCYMMENKERILRGDLCGGALCLNDRQGIISGTEGYIRIDNINCPEVVEVYRNYELVQRYTKDEDMVNGYEYQVIECRRCINEKLMESPMMPHEETISIMKQMDDLRKEWGVRYPYDESYS